jgi:hypothetical protein
MAPSWLDAELEGVSGLIVVHLTHATDNFSIKYGFCTSHKVMQLRSLSVLATTLVTNDHRICTPLHVYQVFEREHPLDVRERPSQPQTAHYELLQ